MLEINAFHFYGFLILHFLNFQNVTFLLLMGTIFCPLTMTNVFAHSSLPSSLIISLGIILTSETFKSKGFLIWKILPNCPPERQWQFARPQSVCEMQSSTASDSSWCFLLNRQKGVKKALHLNIKIYNY